MVLKYTADAVVPSESTLIDCKISQAEASLVGHWVHDSINSETVMLEEEGVLSQVHKINRKCTTRPNKQYPFSHFHPREKKENSS